MVVVGAQGWGRDGKAGGLMLAIFGHAMSGPDLVGIVVVFSKPWPARSAELFADRDLVAVEILKDEVADPPWVCRGWRDDRRPRCGALLERGLYIGYFDVTGDDLGHGWRVAGGESERPAPDSPASAKVGGSPMVVRGCRPSAVA